MQLLHFFATAVIQVTTGGKRISQLRRMRSPIGIISGVYLASPRPVSKSSGSRCNRRTCSRGNRGGRCALRHLLARVRYTYAGQCSIAASFTSQRAPDVYILSTAGCNPIMRKEE